MREKKKTIHTRACPHECAACLIPPAKWDYTLWLDGGCPVCFKADRGDTAYCCDNCYIGLGFVNEKALISFLEKGGVE